MFERADFQRLADQLAGISGGFILSINDVPEIRTMFAWARIEPVTTSYTIGHRNDAAGARAELIVTAGL